MPVSVLMPALSPTMTEGNLVKWHKKEGDSVHAGDILAEIETDKATMEVEAVDEGVLGKILVNAGTEAVKVNTPIALITEEGESVENLTVPEIPSPNATTEPLPVLLECMPTKNSPVALASATSSKRLFVTPLARRLASLKGIDLKTIQGSGPNGRIIKHDIEQYKPLTSSPIETAQSPFTDLPLSGLRKIIAKRLTESKQEIPHFYLSMDYTIDALLDLRKQINTATDQKISVNDFMIKAVALALQKMPEVNVAFVDGKVRCYRHSDIAVAVAIEGGLVTPIIRQAETKSLSELSKEMKVLAERARAGKLMPEEYQGGSFSVSNLGMFGVKSFQAIINPPQACILAIGTGEQKALVQNGQLTIGTVMNCTLSLDHRVVDGAKGAEFLSCLKKLIEAPLQLLL